MLEYDPAADHCRQRMKIKEPAILDVQIIARQDQQIGELARFKRSLAVFLE